MDLDQEKRNMPWLDGKADPLGLAPQSPHRPWILAGHVPLRCGADGPLKVDMALVRLDPVDGTHERLVGGLRLVGHAARDL